MTPHILKEATESKIKLQNLKEDYDRLVQIYQKTLVEVFIFKFILVNQFNSLKIVKVL